MKKNKLISLLAASALTVTLIAGIASNNLQNLSYKLPNSLNNNKVNLEGSVEPIYKNSDTEIKNKSKIITIKNKSYMVQLDKSFHDIVETKEYTTSIYLKSTDNIDEIIKTLSEQNFSQINQIHISSVLPLILITFDDEKFYENNDNILMSLPFVDFSISEVSNNIVNRELFYDKIEDITPIRINNNLFRNELYNYHKTRSNNSHLGKVKVGVLEAGGYVDKNNDAFNIWRNTIHTMDKDITFNKTSDHATAVASLITGKNSITNDTEIYSGVVTNYTDLIKTFEWMIQNGVKIINHSYKRTIVEHIKGIVNGKEVTIDKRFMGYVGYDQFNYYLDYISQRYNITNIFAAGNDAEETFEGRNYEKIEGWALSPNVIAVGAYSKSLNKNNTELISKTDYSESGVEESGLSNKYYSFTDLPKPIIVAEDNVIIKSKKTESGFYDAVGTSFSAPRVTLGLALVDQKFKNLNSRVDTHMAILAASGNNFKNKPYTNGERKNDVIRYNGFDKKVGAGKLDYDSIKIAAQNVKQYEVPHQTKKFEVTTDMFIIDYGKIISIGVAWLYNAGYKMEVELPRNNFLYDFIPREGPAIIFGSNGGPTHKTKEGQANFQEGYTIIKGTIYSDFDVYLENWNAWGQRWETAVSARSSSTNVERLVYENRYGGYTNSFRIRIVKYRTAESKYVTKAIDKMSLSYVIWDKDN
ncbi:subtilase family protein [Mycoplasma testudineum]|uniref:Subtilase family protein n=1 Tax=Mycoplasma testudineum TaxID=244584 RepID=A0A4R6IH66_9MOLU|nr:S8 family serine peptidase [Mycoplasma testudineum]OYD27044.1 hypothetical protein CG473_00115 [Mycoplasma testudineum]TDO21201.1 subtilase family protein [Mycoplasma testudineum]